MDRKSIISFPLLRDPYLTIMFKNKIFTTFLTLSIFFGFTTPALAAQSCPYGSIQIRVQRDQSDPWKESMNGCYQNFRVGAMANNSGRFVEDNQVNKDDTFASFKVTRPDGSELRLRNGEYVYPTMNGTYRVEAKIKEEDEEDITGGACPYNGHNTATVEIQCGSYTPPSYPSNQCPYTQIVARVHRNDSEPWAPSIHLSCGDQFKVGGFFNNSGSWPTNKDQDLNLEVTDPNGYKSRYYNGDWVQASKSGTYTLRASSTLNQCSLSDYAYAYVNCPNPAPSPQPTSYPQPQNNPYQCRYQSTQARARGTNTDWQEKLNLTCGDFFFLGGFHDQNFAQLAGDIVAKVTNPGGRELFFRNGEVIQALIPGTYRLNVYTEGQAGPACLSQAEVQVHCNNWDWNWFQWLVDWWQ